MFGVHNAAVLFLKGATMEGQTFEGGDANVVRATRLMRLKNNSHLRVPGSNALGSLGLGNLHGQS